MLNGLMSTPKKKAIAITVLLLLSLCAGGVLGFIQTSTRLTGLSTEGLIWCFVPAAIVIAGLSYWFGALWMKSIDEAAQEAHKWSWYWGGSAGLAVAMGGYLIHFLPESAEWTVPTLGGRTDPVAYAVTGGVVVLLLMSIGYGIAWIWWWFQRR